MRHEQQALGLALLAAVDVGGGIDGRALAVHVDRAAGQRVERLLGDPHRLLHLGHAHEVAVVVVAVLAERDLELEPVVHPVAAAPARTSKGTPDGAQQRAGDPRRRSSPRARGRRRPTIRSMKIRLPVSEACATSSSTSASRANACGPCASKPGGRSALTPAHAAVGDGQPRAGDVLDELPQELARLDHVEEDGEGARAPWRRRPRT